MSNHCDGLSDLPDSLLTKILSLLKAREVAQTCILSKRWEKLWASVPTLDFDFADFLTIPESSQGDIERFKNFVSSFLNLREDGLDIENFQLKCDVTRFVIPTGILRSARTWILYALNHNPKNLHIMLRAQFEDFHLPECFFTCESIEKTCLNIKGNAISCKIQPDIVFLPKLRALYLSSVTIERDCMEKILVGCPSLESLSLYECDVGICNISLRNLKFLYIFDGEFYEDATNWYISDPNLEYLNIAGAINFPSKLKDMYRVTKAIISTLNVFLGYKKCALLSSLSGVEDMELYDEVLDEMLIAELPNSPIFRNLKILTLGGCCMCCNFDTIPSFPLCCPNLEHLILLHDSRLSQEYGDHDKEDDQDVEQFGRFECENLRLVEVRYKLWHRDVILLL